MRSFVKFVHLMNWREYTSVTYLCGSLLSTLWKYSSKICMGDKCPCSEGTMYVWLCISCTSFLTYFRKPPWDWAIWFPENVGLLCNQSLTELTLPCPDHVSCLQDACGFSAAESSMPSSQLLVNSKFPVWSKVKDRREITNFLPFTFYTLQQISSTRIFA